MANPRKFSEKIALHNQKQAEETAAFEAILREVSATTRVGGRCVAALADVEFRRDYTKHLLCLDVVFRQTTPFSVLLF